MELVIQSYIMGALRGRERERGAALLARSLLPSRTGAQRGDELGCFIDARLMLVCM